MKYIYNYIEHSLNESFNSKEAKKQFLDKGLISKKDYTIIKKAFLPKYVYWGCRERANSENTDIILDSIYDVTVWFEKNKQYLKSKDLYSYSYEEVRLLMNDPSIGPKKKKVKGQGKYKIIYEDDKGNIVVHVQDHTASVYWAHKYREGEIADGQWCTASYSSDDNFKNYSESGPIFIFILPNEKEDYQRVCQAFGTSFVEQDIFSIEELKSKKVHVLDNIKDESEPIYYNASDDVIESFPVIEKTSIILKTTEKYLKQAVTNIAKEQKKFKFNIKDIKDINLYFLYFFYDNNDDGEPAEYVIGPHKEDIVNFCRENLLKITSNNISTLDKKYNFFYHINISHSDFMFASTVEIGNKYHLKYRQHDEWSLPNIKKLISSKNISREELLAYFNVSENPLDLFDKSFIKTYNIRFEIDKSDTRWENNTNIIYVLDFNIPGIKQDFKFLSSGWESTFDIGLIIKQIDKNFKPTIEMLVKYKEDINKLLNLGFTVFRDDITAVGGTVHSSLDHKDMDGLLHFQFGKNYNFTFTSKPSVTYNSLEKTIDVFNTEIKGIK